MTQSSPFMSDHRSYSATSTTEPIARSFTERLATTLLSELPKTKEEASQRIAPVQLSVLRKTLVSMIRRGSLSAWEGDRLSPLFKVIGVGQQEVHLKQLVQNCKDDHRRAQALAALFHSPVGQRIFDQLSDEERVLLCAPWVRPMMALASEDSFPRYALTALFEATPRAQQAHLVRRFEECRREVGGCPLGAYEVLLKQARFRTQELELLFELIQFQGQLPQLKPLICVSPTSVQQSYHKVLESLSTHSKVS